MPQFMPRTAYLCQGDNVVSFYGTAKAANDALHRILFSKADTPQTPAFFPLRALPNHADRRYLLIAQLPLRLTEALNLASSIALIRVGSVQASWGQAASAAAAAFQLSKAETRILNHLLAGRSIEEIASLGGVSPGTVRLQLKSLYAKSGSHRQAELVSYVLSNFDPSLRINLAEK